jgi:hypothetical protein
MELQLRLPLLNGVVKTSVAATRTGGELVYASAQSFSAPTPSWDRSQMAYPFLVGRNVLKGRFIVDPSNAKAVRTVYPPGAFPGEESTSGNNRARRSQFTSLSPPGPFDEVRDVHKLF